MSKKRKREVDLELVKVYEDLAHDQESVRLAAAHTLLTQIYKQGITTNDQLKTILTRLFRGLCSGRKSARLGFSVALTELLSQLASTQHASQDTSLFPLIDILEAQSSPETGTSGQDERDHHFGRVFGAEAILKSGICFAKGNGDEFDRLLELLCALALKKPWLRQECGWILFNCIASQGNELSEVAAVQIIDKLVSNKLIRTPEGVAIWLSTAKRFPKAELPKSAWKGGDPLARADVHILAEILKDARALPNQQDAELSAQGSARWSANLHFAWDVVLAEIFADAQAVLQFPKGVKSTASREERLPFNVFWNVAVEESLFLNSASAERRAWGLSLWRKVLETAPPELLRHTFTTRATHYLSNSLKAGSERLLQKSAQRVIQTIQGRFANLGVWPDAGDLAATYIQALLESVSFGDFDQITKTKTVHGFIEVLRPSVLETVNSILAGLVEDDSTEENEKGTLTKQKTIISLQGKIISIRLRRWEECQWEHLSGIDKEDLSLVSGILESWLNEICVSLSTKLPKKVDKKIQPKLQPQARDFAKERLGLAFEHILKLGPTGGQLLKHVVLHVNKLETLHVQMAITFEDDVREILQTAWSRLSAIRVDSEKPDLVKKSMKKSSKNSAPTQSLSFSEALSLLYCLLLFQIYSGEAEAIPILQEVLEYDDARRNDLPSTVGVNSADAIMEILLSFASRPSKLLRRITIQIFEAFAPHLSDDGLEALCRVLDTKENIQGQQEMFQSEDVDMQDVQSGADSDDDHEVDSDVQVVSNPESDASSDGTDSATTSDDDSGDDAEEASEEEEKDEELAKFDAALAAALGTRQLKQEDLAAAGDGSDSSPDEDMDDDQMAELDSKLVEVFRNRNVQLSRNKKKEAKDAKENIVNFKNRVLDLMETYFKIQQHNGLTINLMLPLLRLARTTQTKQLADRACNILQQYSSRCKGPHAPELLTEDQRKHAVDTLKSIHEEASLQSSNVHSNVASLCSILVVKALVKADPMYVGNAVEVYGSTRVRQLTQKSCRVLPGFFTDWNNWCQTARDKLAQ